MELMLIFNIFRSGGRREECYSSVDEVTAAMQRWTKVRKSDEDKAQWGPSEPDIDMKAADYIAHRKKVTESEVHQFLESGGRREECYSSVDEGTAAMQGLTKVRKSDEDKGQLGPSDPDIDMKATAFIARYKESHGV